MEDENFKILISHLGFVTRIEKPHENSYDFKQEFWSYSGINAGAYVFNPNDTGEKLSDLVLDSMKISTGNVVQVAEIV